MKRFLFLPALALLASMSVQAQGLATEAQQAWMRTRNYLVAAAEMMEDSHYNYKPFPESMSYGQIVAHVADSAVSACSAVTGNRQMGHAADMTTKADLVGALNQAMDLCDGVYKGLTDANATDMIAGGRGGGRTRLGSLYANTIHLEHEYAQMTIHLRMNGHVPPSSLPRGGMGGGGMGGSGGMGGRGGM